MRAQRPEDDQYSVTQLVRRVISVSEPAMRRHQIERHLLTVDAATAAEHLHDCITQGVRGDGEAQEVVLAAAEAVMLAADRFALALEAVHLEARREGRHAVGWFLLDPPAFKVADSMRLRRAGERSLTLGERKSQAAGWDQRRLERLIDDPEPMVIEKLVANPRVGDRLILSIVSARPNLPARICAVARTPRWFSRPPVRSAIAQNPYTPTGLALRCLPLASYADLERIRVATDLHPALRLGAAYLLSVRQGRPDGPTPDELDRLPA